MAKKPTKAQREALEKLASGEFVQLHTDSYNRHNVRRDTIASLVNAGYLKHINAYAAILTEAGAAAIGRADLFAAPVTDPAPVDAPAVDTFAVGDYVRMLPAAKGGITVEMLKQYGAIGHVIGMSIDPSNRQRVDMDFWDVDMECIVHLHCYPEWTELVDIGALSSKAPVTVNINDRVRYIGKAPIEASIMPPGAIGSVIRIYPELAPESHLVLWDDKDMGDLGDMWFNPADLEVITDAPVTTADLLPDATPAAEPTVLDMMLNEAPIESLED